MSYNKTIWKPGDIITTEKWNNLTNNIPELKIIQIPLEFMKHAGERRLLITSEQLNNYIKNGYFCYYVLDNDFYYYTHFEKNLYYFGSTRWIDTGNGYLEDYLSVTK